MHLSAPEDKEQWVAYWLKWMVISGLIGILSGSTSALFLVLLDWVTQTRYQFSWLIWLLPVAGFLIGWVYHTWGKPSVGGTHLVVQEIKDPSPHILPWLMAPLVLGGTLLTHLVGGSAGREGTAAQMGGALADQFSRAIHLLPSDKRTLLICGVSAGFASVFGTPWAGAVFGLEVAALGKNRWRSLGPSIMAAFVADAVTTALGVGHTKYPAVAQPEFSWLLLGAVLAAGICFGLASRLFVWVLVLMVRVSHKMIGFAPFRPVMGGLLILGLTFLVGTDRYLGLGIPVLEQSFLSEVPKEDFLLKILFTAITLGFGFKGGEVTPLFFIGASLGNAMSGWLPLPLELLVGMGFVAVFAGAANAPIACVFMAMELFGIDCGLYMALACTISFLVSPAISIYGQQKDKPSLLALLNLQKV